MYADKYVLHKYVTVYVYSLSVILYFLNQVYSWFLEITLVQTLVCVYVHVRVCCGVCPLGYENTFHMKQSLNNQLNKSYCFSLCLCVTVHAKTSQVCTKIEIHFLVQLIATHIISGGSVYNLVKP